jgi:hypothetical protein
MLGRGVDQHVLLLRHRHRHLAFEVEVILAADCEGAGEAVAGARESRGGVAALERDRRGDEQLALQRSSIVSTGASFSYSIRASAPAARAA